MLTFRNTYILDLQQKRRSSRGFQAQKENSLRIQNNAILEQLSSAQTALNVAKQEAARLPAVWQNLNGNLTITQNSLAVAKAKTPPNQSEITRLEQQKTDIENQMRSVNNVNDRIAALEQRTSNLQIASIVSLVKDNEAVNGKNPKVRANEIAAKFLIVRQGNSNVDPVSFTEEQIRLGGKAPGPLVKIENATEKLASATSRFTNLIEGRPNSNDSARQARDPYHIFDPAVCGLVALDNEGNLLAEESFNIPFQYVHSFKESKAGNWESTNPPGRFEPYHTYSGAESFQISFTAEYHAFDTGPDFDEGFVQEIKDRLFASQYPIYSKNQRSGVRSYGTPNKYLLNVFSRYRNVPVIVSQVAPDEEFALDPGTWLPMGFRLNIELKTSFRMSQVISADDVVKKGIRAYSHRQVF